MKINNTEVTGVVLDNTSESNDEDNLISIVIRNNTMISSNLESEALRKRDTEVTEVITNGNIKVSGETDSNFAGVDEETGSRNLMTKDREPIETLEASIKYFNKK